jgi:molybdate transport system substrate-binding protein
MNRIVGLSLILVLAVTLVACGSGSSAASTTGATTAATGTTAAAASPATTAVAASQTAAAIDPIISGDLTIFAASSLTEAFNQMKTEIEAANPGTKITLNFAGSSALRTQITQGAQTDIFASADKTNMDPVVQAGDIVGRTSIFAQNRLVLVIPKGNPGKINTLQDLANVGVKLVLAQEQVPVGNYSRQSLDKMTADPAFGADFKTKVLANVVSNELNVKDVIAKVQLGEADAGIVYKTDANSADPSKVTMIDIPDQYNIVAQYPIGVVKGGANAAGAQAFISYLLSPAGQAVMAKYGFIAAPAQ